MTITYKNVVEHLTRTYPMRSKQLKKMTEIINNIDDLERVRHEIGEYWQTELHNKPGIL